MGTAGDGFQSCGAAQQARKLVQQKVGLLWAWGPGRGGGTPIGAPPHGLTVIGQ